MDPVTLALFFGSKMVAEFVGEKIEEMYTEHKNNLIQTGYKEGYKEGNIDAAKKFVTFLTQNDNLRLGAFSIGYLVASFNGFPKEKLDIVEKVCSRPDSPILSEYIRSENYKIIRDNPSFPEICNKYLDSLNTKQLSAINDFLAALIIAGGSSVNEINFYENDWKGYLKRHFELCAEEIPQYDIKDVLSRKLEVKLLSVGQKKNTLKQLLVGVEWDIKNVNKNFELYVSAFLLQRNGKVAGDGDCVFFGNVKHKSGAIEHISNKSNGIDQCDYSHIKISLDKVPADIAKIALTITLYEAKQRKQNFGQIENAFIRVINLETNEELIHYDLNKNFSTENAVVIGELYFENGDWKFNAIGSRFRGGFAALCKNYGVDIVKKGVDLC